MESTLAAYNKTVQNQDYKNFNGTDLIVILGNAVNGSAWDGKDPNYFQDRWDAIMNIAIKY